MEFRILGPLEVLDGGAPVEIAGTKRRAVLALLLFHANEVIRTERLIDDLWGERAPRNATAALHNHISRLRKALGADVIARREWGYVLRTPPESIDLRRFELLVDTAEPLAARERSGKLAEALKIWRGPPLADLAGESGLRTDIARLEELWLETLERRIDADLEAGRSGELVGELEALIAANPLREHLRAQLILALYRSGRQAEALEVYRETRRMLTDELGLEPSPALKELEKAILQQDPSIAAAPASRPAGGEPRRRRRRLVPLLLAVVLAGGAGTALALEGRDHHAAATAAAQPTTTVVDVVHARLGRTRHIATPKQPTRTVETPDRRTSTTPRRHGPQARSSTTLSTATVERRLPSKPRPTGTSRHVAAKTSKRPVTIADDFSGGGIDGTIWYQIYQGSGWSLAQHDGYLDFAFPPGTAPGGTYDNYGGHVGTVCKFVGDFDARVDFTLVSWPPGNGVVVSLWSFFQPDNEGWEVWRQSSAQWGELYGSYLGPGRSPGVSLDDSTGTLRLVRRAGVLTAYFRHKGKWLSLGSAANARITTLAVGAGSATGPPVRSDRVDVRFDNFRVTAADPICPLGAQGSG